MSTREQDKQEWIDCVYNNAESVDPNNERDWRDLAFGFFLGKGYDTQEAYDLICELDRYM